MEGNFLNVSLEKKGAQEIRRSTRRSGPKTHTRVKEESGEYGSQEEHEGREHPSACKNEPRRRGGLRPKAIISEKDRPCACASSKSAAANENR